MLQGFIQQAAGQIGASESDVSQGVGGLLSLVKGQADAGQFSSLLGAIPGADGLLNQFDSASSSSSAGGLLGGLGGMLGGSAGGALGAAGIVSQLNLDSGQFGSLATLFVDFAKEHVGADMVQNLLGGLGDFLPNQAA